MRKQRSIVLLDTGSEADWVSLHLLKKLNWEHKIIPNDHGQRVLTADGREVPVRGSVKILYHIGGFQEYREFGVLDGCRDDIILGMPFHAKYNPTINYVRRTMAFRRDGSEVTEANKNDKHETFTFSAYTPGGFRV